ncbi:TPA: LysM peptidoglycan-binding domain-containing protein, partial [Bacillus thuringiensis]|nr:LysM peptidoglycan-binding domain-containing protein [Bacillus thuringiensis]
VYTVQKNDTLGEIGNQYGISVQVLKQANNKTTDQIQIGERLTIPISSTSTGHLQQNTLKLSSPSYQIIYQVKSGDTLG